MTGYLIKVTYTSGRHQGHSYLLQKGGYVHDETKDYEWRENTYKTRGIADRICRKLKADNEINIKDERMWHDICIKQGYVPDKKYWLYENEEYEPFEIEVIG